jgi:threonylcarbamoyladenosine tRNA methylthiotransferase MtaB
LNVYLDMVGCRLNQGELEIYAAQFRSAGYQLVDHPAQADLVVVNTCTVTSEAASDSRQKIRQATRAGAREIVVTGCWSTLQPEQAAALPGVSRVISNHEKDSLVARVLGLPETAFDLDPVAREPVPGARLRTRAFIKVQDGCDNHCTFCITTVARGASHSRPVETVIRDIQAALAGGAREIVLTGVHLGSWGYDFSPGLHLSDLVKSILEHTETERLRLSSLEPWDLDEPFFQLWEDRRVCRHLHLPLQSGSEKILKRMARKTRPDTFLALVEAARTSIPQVAITTDLIVGFPGEDESDFQESLDYVRHLDLAGGHVFTYSPRPGTAAAHFPQQILKEARKERNARMREILSQAALKYRLLFLGQTMPVLWETAQGVGPEGWQLSGLTDNYLRVSAQAPSDQWNQITPVRLDRLEPDGMVGSFPGL